MPSKMKNPASGPKLAVSAMPVRFTRSSVFCAMWRGSREYFSCVIESTMLQIIDSVVLAPNGSSTAVPGSGTTSMSLAWIACQPRMLEPSNPGPSSQMSGVAWLTGMVKCCQVPGKSPNLRSMTWTSLSLTSLRTSCWVCVGTSLASGGETEGPKA